MSEQLTSTKNLKRVLGKKELLSIGIGQTIGSGIFALTGVAMGMTGKSVNIAMLIAGVFVIAMAVPMLFVSGSVRLRGGFYTQLGLLAGKKFAGFFVIVHIIANVSLAMYALSFADYMMALIPGIPHKLVAILILTLFYVTNLLGIQGAAKLQNFMIVVMGAALAIFVAFGMPHVQPGYFTGPEFMTAGITGLLSAGALLTWAAGGASVVIHLGAEAKNPTKDIPFVLIFATLIVCAFYAFMATVAAGVLPLEQVINKPLALVAETVLPAPLYMFFIIGGAMFALTTTLNATFGWITKPVLQASIDGWLPKGLAIVNTRYQTPHVLLTVFYFVGLLPILFNFNIGTIANYAVILNNVAFAFICFSAMNLPKVIPDMWKASRFHVSNAVLYTFSIIGGLATIAQIYLLFGVISNTEIIGNVVVCILAFLFAHFRHASGKVDMEISYEAA